MRKKLIIVILFFTFFQLSAVNFDPDESYNRFIKGHGVGFSIFPLYEGDSTLLEFDLYGNFYFSMLRFGFLLPVRFIIYNNDNIETAGKIFPKEDWDDARDYVSILTFFQYGFKSDLFYFYFGEHKNRYVRNGTILGGYFNNLKLRFPKRGVNIEVNTDYAGLDFFMDDVTPPNVVGGRAYVKPVSFFSKQNYANNLEIGASYFADIFSPYNISIVSPGGIPKRDIEKYTDHLFGFDISFRFVATKLYHMKFYSDINKIVDGGFGLHFGLEHEFLLPFSTDMKILSRWEYRAMESNYIPSYFNTFYDTEREYYRNGQTKSRFVNDSSREGLDWTHGYYLDLVYDLTGTFAVGGSFEHNRIYKNNVNDGKFDNFQLNLFVNALIFNRIGTDFIITFQDLGEKGKRMKDQPFYNLSVYYKLNEYLSLGFYTGSKWYLAYSGTSVATESYYKNTAVYSVGAYGMMRF